jgi:cytochrome oxidase Cu insertion factor (SCO1/SenC/PrrC family)
MGVNMSRRVLTASLIAVLAVFIAASTVFVTAQNKKPAQTKGVTSYTAPLKVGDVAPNFTLKNQDGKDVSLSQFRGNKSVALAFYVFAFTGG